MITLHCGALLEESSTMKASFKLWATAASVKGCPSKGSYHQGSVLAENTKVSKDPVIWTVTLPRRPSTYDVPALPSS